MKKYHYYVGVKTAEGITLVTSRSPKDKSAEWDRDKIPLEMPRLVAEDLSWGLFLNGFPAFVIRSYFPLDRQPLPTEEKGKN